MGLMSVGRAKIGAFISALSIHGALLFGGDAVFVRPAEYGVEAGLGGVEISLVAAPAEEIAQSISELETNPIQTQDEAPKLSPDAPKITDAKGDGSSAVPGRDATTFSSQGGAFTEAKPGHLKNPAPSYPELARQKGEEGVVILRAYVIAAGKASRVEVKQSSGFPLLDEAALKAVRRWQFEPARVGSVAMDSTVEIPVRFQLSERS